MYNRSPAYDGIVAAMERKAKEAAEAAEAERTTSTGDASATTGTDVHSEKYQDSKLRKSQKQAETTVDGAGADEPSATRTKKDPLPAFLQLLPIHLECNRGAIVLGNENTKCVVTASFEKAAGEIDAAKSGPLDVYQQVFNLRFTHPVVHMRLNPDFKASQLETAALLKQDVFEGVPLPALDEDVVPAEPKPTQKWFTRLPFASMLFAKSSDSVHAHPSITSATHRRDHPHFRYPGEEEWQGLSRYLGDGQNAAHSEWSDVDYAKVIQIVDCPQVNVRFYWDVAGPVPTELENSVHFDRAYAKDINGTAPPDYGMELQVFGGTINYGPWADQHRAMFQNVYFPGSHVDATPAPSLVPGDTRVLSLFKIFLTIEEDTILRIPIRESSKDWKWKGKAAATTGKDKQQAEKAKGKGKSRRKFKHKDKAAQNASSRPFGWVDVKVSSNSSIKYIMDMVAYANGFSGKLDVDIPGAEISSSVNHGLLWRSGPVTVSCDLSTPLGWNALRKWYFHICCRELELFLLRDHLFLLTDLVADWGAGPPSDYFSFVPFQYFLSIDFSDFKLYINTNDSNIVNNPTDLEDNNFLVLFGQRLHGDVTIPLDQFRPRQNEIRFDVQGQDAGLEASMPSRSTLNTFVRSKKVATLRDLTLSGSHTYMTDTSFMNTDRLFLDIKGKTLSLDLYGWVVHHFMKIKDNYFGDDMHFKTSEEFQGLPSQNIATDATVPHGETAKTTNDLDVIISVTAEQGSVLLPSNLYSAESCLRADIAFATADLRFTNYYMDLMTNFSPIGLSLSTASTGSGRPKMLEGRTEVFIDSIVIAGHRLFGLPPVEPTYVCNWDFDVGDITGECSTEFVEKAVGSARSFAFTFEDPENTFAATEIPIIHDVTFLRLNTGSVRLWFHVANEALLLSTGPISLNFNDLASEIFSERLNLSIPDFTVSAVDARSAIRHRGPSADERPVKAHAFLETSLTVNMLGRKLGFTEQRNKQQAHIREHDERTNRTPYMLLQDRRTQITRNGDHQNNIRPPAMQFPELPFTVKFDPVGSTSRPSSMSSSFYTSSQSTSDASHRAPTFRSASGGSLAGSIRAAYGYSSQNTANLSSKSETHLTISSPDEAMMKRGYKFPSVDAIKGPSPIYSSVAMSSSLASPHFPLIQVEPDLSEVPSFPSIPSTSNQDGIDDVHFNDVAQNHLDERFSHTSLIVMARPGIRAYCTPEAVRCVSDLVELVLPRHPEDLLDDFQDQVMTKIMDFRKHDEGKGDSLEWCVRVPFTHFRCQNTFTPTNGTADGKDQYDIILNQLNVAARTKKFPIGLTDGPSLAVHANLGSLGFSVTERLFTGPNDDVAVQAELKDLLVWASKKEDASLNVSFKTFEVATASKKVAYLASLIHRTTLLSNGLVLLFEEAREKYKSRLRYLAWFLTTVQPRLPDPPFLTKASYALRATKDHLRNHDSWKIISRFRYIWQCLPQSEQIRLDRQCSSKTTACPEGLEEKLITMWDQWRAWDLAHVRKSLAMKTLFDMDGDKPLSPSSSAIYLDLRAHSVELAVDPGPDESKISLSRLILSVAAIPPLKPTGLMLVPAETPKRSTTVQLTTNDTSITVRWALFELVEILSVKFHQDKPERPSYTQPFPERVAKVKGQDQDFQFVYVSETANLGLDTINLNGLATGQRLRFSLAISDKQASDEGHMTTVLVHLERGIMQLDSGRFPRFQKLLKAQYDCPSLYIAHHASGGDTAAQDQIKVAGASQTITLKVEEDILGIIEVVDAVVRDEVASLYRQATALRQSVRKGSELSVTSQKSSQLPNITLALFMDEYSIELALLRSLTWTVEGSAGRISVVPALGRNVTLRIDYDLSAHCHRLVNQLDDNTPHVVSTLDLPPLNGRLALTNTDNEMRISASGIIEMIQLQASEVQALIATINKPEVTHAIRAIQEDIQILQAHIREVFPTSSQGAAKASKSSQEIVFNVGMTLSGLCINATAPGKSIESPTANLALRLAAVQLKASNVGADLMKLPLPEAVAHMGEMSIEMTLTGSETIRRCGNLTVGATFHATYEDDGGPRRAYHLRSSGLEVNIFADTASAVVDVANHLQDKIRDLDLSKERGYFKRLRNRTSRISPKKHEDHVDTADDTASTNNLFASAYSLELLKIQVSWIVGTSIAPYAGTETEDLVLSFRKIAFSTRKGDSARLSIEDMQLQMVPESGPKDTRSRSSALLPEVVFNVSYASSKDSRSIAFQAAGKSLDVRLDSRFLLPANVIERSIALAVKKVRAAAKDWSLTPTNDGVARKNPFGNKRMGSLLVSANFAGAVVHINGAAPESNEKSRALQKGRYSQFIGDESKSSMALQAPGIALKVEFKDNGTEPTTNAELRINASSNTLFPTVVPILIDISESIKELVREKDSETPIEKDIPDAQMPSSSKILEDDNFITADPSQILGRNQLNFGLRICKQEFSLSCQPIARVAAIAKIEDIYVTVNSVKSQEHGHFFAASAAFQNFQAKVQHVYSRDSTFGFNVDSIILSLMNSKHLSGTSGISAILKINPIGLQVNARQLQDFLLFREIWLPPEIRNYAKPSRQPSSPEPQEYLIQKYEQVTAATAFPWNANVAIADVAVELDLGQAIGKTSLHLHNLWASSKKSTNWEQNLCIGAETLKLESTGRTSGFVELNGAKIRTAISWPSQALGLRQTPLVQAVIGFQRIRAKVGFDYQAFLIGNISNFNFLMYNVRDQVKTGSDRLVAVLDGGQVQVCCTATSAAQGLALFQAIERLVQDNQQAYTQSLKDIEKFLRRKSSVSTAFGRSASQGTLLAKPTDNGVKAPISLHTDVVVTLRSIHLGVYPSTFVDNQLFSIEAADVQARFAVALEQGKIHSGLGMTLGKLSVALASISSPKKMTPVSDLTVEEVLDNARSARGGIILRVPKVIATMHTWQVPKSDEIDYIFQSHLEGKVDVGWNYSRISYIRTMWSNHSRTLAQRLGKPLPESNIKITSSQANPASPGPSSPSATANLPKPPISIPPNPFSINNGKKPSIATTSSSESDSTQAKETINPSGNASSPQEKITVETKVPQSRYTYHALEPPIIDTPQLRDMGEATPPLEWIGLHRDRLPNITHQVFIVTLLEVAREVEEAYTRILGSS